jgi:hypothetical protein
MVDNPFEMVAQRIRKELRHAITHEIGAYKLREDEKGRDLSWGEACKEWAETHRDNLEQFLKNDLSTPD